MNLKKLFVFSFLIIQLLVAVGCDAQQLEKVGNTKVGILYIDTDSVQTIRKAEQYFLMVAAEEVFTDQQFLTSIRQDEDLKNAASAMYLYLFDNRGANYCLAAHYIIDEAGKVCVDMGADMELKPVAGKQYLVEAYTKALKLVETKYRWQKH